MAALVLRGTRLPIHRCVPFEYKLEIIMYIVFLSISAGSQFAEEMTKRWLDKSDVSSQVFFIPFSDNCIY